MKSPVEAWHSSDEVPGVDERLDESFVSTVNEDEEWEDSGGWGSMGSVRHAGIVKVIECQRTSWTW